MECVYVRVGGGAGGGVTVTLRLDQGDEWWRSLKISSNNILK